jgi:hypothetical protein
MPFNVGDTVFVAAPQAPQCSQAGRIEQVLPSRNSLVDFQEYVVAFPLERSRRLQFGLYREFELRGSKVD